MNILVTGASGFLGRHLCHALEAKGLHVTEVHSKNGDLTKPHALDAFNSTRFDKIYHLAAWTQAGDFCLHHPGEQWVINQQINTHVLDWWQRRQPQAKLIAIGTSCGYDPTLPLSEEYYLQGVPIDSLYTYAMTKRMLLCGLLALHRQYGLEFLYLIPSTLYGPGYHTDGRQMHFIFDLIRKVLRGHFHQEPVVLWGDGEQKRELMHVQDFVAVSLQLDQAHANTLVNVGTGQEHSIKEFARLLCTNIGYPFGQIEYDLSKYVGARSKVLSVEKLKRLLPDFQPISLSQGLDETVHWFERQFFPSKRTQVQSESTHTCEVAPG